MLRGRHERLIYLVAGPVKDRLGSGALKGMGHWGGRGEMGCGQGSPAQREVCPAPSSLHSSPTWVTTLHLGAFYASLGHCPHGLMPLLERADSLPVGRPGPSGWGCHWHYHFRASHRWGSCIVGPR